MAELIFPDSFNEKCTIAQDDLILMADSEDGNKIKKAKYSFLKGETGEQGPEGPQGCQGIQGEQGPQGCQGIAATITVGDVCTGAEGSCVCVTNTGTCNDAILNFTIPKGAKGDTGCTGPAIICAEFNGNDIDFTEENCNVVKLTDAKLCLQGPQGCNGEAGNGICCAVLNPDYTLTLQYTNGCCDTTGSIRGEQGPAGCEGPQGCTGPTGNGISCIEQNADYTLTIHYTNGCCDTTGSVRGEQGPQGCTGPTGCTGPEGPSICSAQFNGNDIEFEKTNGSCVVLTDAKLCLQGPQGCQGPSGCEGPAGNGICCITSTKAGKVTTVEAHYTCGGSDCFCVCDGQDGQGAGDMLACVYDPCNCAKDVFDYDNLHNTPDLTCYQEKLTAGNGIDITSNTISTTFVYGESSTAAATVQKEVSIPSITELNVGQVIIVKPTVTSTVASSTLKLNDFPAYKMLYNGSEISTSTDSTVWAANVPSMFYLDEVSGTRYWRFLGHGLDSNTTYTLNRLIDPSRYKVGTGTYAFSRYSLVMEKADGTWEKITNTAASYSTGTTKTVNTNGFRLGHIRYYNTTTNLANGALVATSALDIQAPSVNAAYSFNCGTAPGWSVGDPIYIVGTMGVDGLFYLDTTQWWSNQLPNTNDGKLYIRIGTALAADNANISLITEKPIFYYDNGIKVYGQADNKQDVISDLDNIRNGAACGASALQSINCGDVTTALGYTPAQSCDIPTDNCQLCNSCGYTTCTGTVVAGDLAAYAKNCDLCTVATTGKYCDLTGTPTIPTDNCQLNNGCGYTTCTGTVSSCSDIITKLGYTPYSSANPNGYTTCTGTLTALNICDSALSSAWDGVTTKAPSMNAVYDAIGDIETLLSNI